MRAEEHAHSAALQHQQAAPASCLPVVDVQVLVQREQALAHKQQGLMQQEQVLAQKQQALILTHSELVQKEQVLSMTQHELSQKQQALAMTQTDMTNQQQALAVAQNELVTVQNQVGIHPVGRKGVNLDPERGTLGCIELRHTEHHT